MNLTFLWSKFNYVIDSKRKPWFAPFSFTKWNSREKERFMQICRYVLRLKPLFFVCDFHKFSLNLKRDITRKWHVNTEKKFDTFWGAAFSCYVVKILWKLWWTVRRVILTKKIVPCWAFINKSPITIIIESWIDVRYNWTFHFAFQALILNCE